mmetsp:Transcript_77071/g.121710  ORF Transcript_77071/g.121710 Transcript_77071/m.121710 type:complete len:246 (-) Transcript_77071:115-852(-)|eukprot:CAMPEP_0169147758 /NCGR_PEP_ID=MMETSP1015-20121227/48426_1 /TAXON_ID=342587 /ORGANISM="Karlodinium micrum, Strain CCMP2283" /LENGTH=245 /DNA_ID=CAMNT_0009216057 /DNA_START=70 /DNA_END=807 /DNA_ORIENTATION=-
MSFQDKLYISDLPAGMKEDQLRNVFSQYGQIIQCKPLQGGAALIRFSSVEEAKWIVENVNASIPRGLASAVSVKYATRSTGGNTGGKGYDQWGGHQQWDQMMDLLKGSLKGLGKGWAPKDSYSLVKDLCSGGRLPGGRRWQNDENTLFIGGLPEDMSDLDMYIIFAPFGAIAPRGASARIDKATGRCTGIGFVNYLDADSAQNAMRTLNGHTMSDGSVLSVKRKGPAKSKGDGKGDSKTDVFEKL